MDLKDDDVVADICAAPGGKTLAMILTKTPKMVFAIDKSWSRMLRFKEVFDTNCNVVMIGKIALSW